jgi:hypothetical protein
MKRLEKAGCQWPNAGQILEMAGIKTNLDCQVKKNGR